MRVRVMTFNIRLGGRNAAGVQELVREVAPDVLLVNECPKTPFLWRSHCERLAGASGLRYVCGGRSAGSNMIAVSPSVEVTGSAAETIPQPMLRPRRGVASAQLQIGDQLLGVVSCHLSLSEAGREVEVERVVEIADRLHGPVVVGGDLNEPAGGPCWEILETAGYVDHGTPMWKTFPAKKPRKRIDGVLVRGAAEVVAYGDPGVSDALVSSASDHRPVLAELDIS